MRTRAEKKKVDITYEEILERRKTESLQDIAESLGLNRQGLSDRLARLEREYLKERVKALENENKALKRELQLLKRENEILREFK